jgi:autotransporter-associated beta strand protein
MYHRPTVERRPEETTNVLTYRYDEAASETEFIGDGIHVSVPSRYRHTLESSIFPTTRSISMKPPILSHRKAFLAVQAALAVMIVTTPVTALSDSVNDDNASQNTYTSSNLTINNPSSDIVFTENADFFELSESTSAIIGDVNGSDNDVTLNNTSDNSRHVIGELRDMTGNPANEWAEGNVVNLTGGNYVDVAGGVATGKAFAGKAGNGNTVNLSGGVNISGAVFGGLATGSGNAEHNRVNIAGGDASHGKGKKIYGGYSAAGQANGNEVRIENSAHVAGIEEIIGGHAGSSAHDNHVTIEGGTFSNESGDISILGGEIGSPGAGANSESTGNTVTIRGGSFSASEINIEATYGAGSASNNRVTIEGGEFSVPSEGNGNDEDSHDINITGATVSEGDAFANTVDINGGTFTAANTETSGVYIIGGYVSQGNGNATGNTVNVGGKATRMSASLTLTSANLYGGYVTGTGDAFTGNTLVFKSGWAGAVGSARNFARIVFENGSGLTGGDVIVGHDSVLTEINVAGEATLSAKLSGAGFEKTGTGTLTLSSDNGNEHLATTVSDGTLAIDNDKPLGNGVNTLGNATLKLLGTTYSKGWTIASGATGTIEVTQDNTVFGSTDTETRFAASGTLILDAGNHNATFWNIVNASGGNLVVDKDGNIILAGANSYTGSTTVKENSTLTLAENATLENPVLTLEKDATFDRSASGATHSLAGGTLNVTDHATYKGKLDAEGATVNFKLVSAHDPETPILTIDGSANLKNATLTAGVVGGSNAVSVGQQLNLLSVSDNEGSDYTGLHAGLSDQGLIGIELGELVFGEDGRTTAKVLRFVAEEKTKAYAEGFLGGVAALASASDNAVKGISSAARSVRAGGGAPGMAGFTELGGGSLKYKTGSHVDVDGYNLVAGIASGSDFAAGQLTVGAFVEHGKGDYSSYNSFASGKVKGKGDTDYAGGGVLARFAFGSGLYLDGTLRVGKVGNDFRSAQIAASARTSYDASSRYHGAHVGVGKLWKLGDNGVEVFGQYLWTHQKGDKARIKGVVTTMELDFDDVDSRRLRIGARYSHALKTSLVGYVGAGWEKEFDGKAKGTLNGNKLQTPELKGDSGLVEVGLSTAPLAKTPLTIDVGLQGYWGQREGVTGGIKVNYRF